MSTKLNTLAVFTVSAIIASLLTGCGSTPGSVGLKEKTRRSLTSATGSTIDSGDTDIGDADFGASTGSANGETLKFDLSQNGAAEITVTASARSVLRVRFIPGEPTLVRETAKGWEHYQGYYTQMAVTIAVGTREFSTALLSNGFMSQKQVSSVLDFSNVIGATSCSSSDPDCRQEVTIKIKNPRYDYHCFNWGHTCPNSKIEATHAWSGVLEVQTDDTVSL